MKLNLWFIPLCFVAAGCGDAIFYTDQSVTVALRSRSAGEPVVNATVGFAPVEGYKKEAGSEDDWIDRHLRVGNIGWYVSKKPANQGVTDNSGIAKVAVDTSVIAGGWFTNETPLRDRLSGKEYFLRVKRQADTEIFRVKIVTDNKFEGEKVNGEILNVGRPREFDMAPTPARAPVAD
jgi:hypothetical protein